MKKEVEIVPQQSKMETKKDPAEEVVAVLPEPPAYSVENKSFELNNCKMPLEGNGMHPFYLI
jgi:hypothetical protein